MRFIFLFPCLPGENILKLIWPKEGKIRDFCSILLPKAVQSGFFRWVRHKGGEFRKVQVR